MADRLLPMLVGAMSFLAALAIAGTLAAASLAVAWNQNTGTALTVQVPDPADPAVPSTGVPKTANRQQAAIAVLQAQPNVDAARALTAAQMNDLLKPWLGEDATNLAVPIPAVVTASWAGSDNGLDALRVALNRVAPGTSAETGERWAARVAALTGSLQTSALTILLIVALVAAAVISVATHAGLAQRREAIDIIHGLGALDSDIAGRFAARATILAAVGAAVGALLALPVLFWLAALAAPFAGVLPRNNAPGLPLALWVALPALPAAAAAIGWVTTQFTVRGWLRRLA